MGQPHSLVLAIKRGLAPDGKSQAFIGKQVFQRLSGQISPQVVADEIGHVIDAALALYQRLDLARAEEGAGITEVTVTTDAPTYEAQFAPGSTKRRPTQVVEAQFSLPFLVATALTRGGVGISNVARVDHPAVLALSDRMQAEVRADAPAGWARIMVRRTDGRSDCLETTSPSGSPERPLSEAQLHAKFRDCAANAVRTLSPEAVERAIHLVHNLAEAADATALIRLFGPEEKL